MKYQSLRKPICIRGHDTTIIGRNKDGCCKSCRIYYNKNQDNRSYKLKSNYGMTLEQYNDLFNKQKGLCLGCYKHQSQLKRRLNVDHDHKTGRIRGLLCDLCNKVLGSVYDNPETLRRLAEYLGKKW